MRLQFLGANRQVTGSRYYLESNGTRVLVDCGMFQERDYLDRNWEASPIEPKKIDVVLRGVTSGGAAAVHKCRD